MYQKFLGGGRCLVFALVNIGSTSLSEGVSMATFEHCGSVTSNVIVLKVSKDFIVCVDRLSGECRLKFLV